MTEDEKPDIPDYEYEPDFPTDLEPTEEQIEKEAAEYVPPKAIIVPEKVDKIRILSGIRRLGDQAAINMMDVCQEVIMFYDGLGNAKVHMDAAAKRMGAVECAKEGNVWLEGLITDPFAQAAPDPPEVFYGIYRRAVTTLNGGSGAGKSTAFYNMVYMMASPADLVKELWGIEIKRLNDDQSIRAEGEKILVFDPENRGSVRPQRLKEIEEYSGIPYPMGNLHWHDASGMNMSNPTVMNHCIQLLKDGGYTGAVFDPISFLWDIANENDNSEAQRQYKTVSRLVDETGCFAIMLHHTGKNEDGGARGAQARNDLSYVGMSLRLAGEKDDDEDDDYVPGVKVEREDFVRLRKFKDRFNGAKTSIYLRMDGKSSFVRIGREEYLKAQSGNGSISAADQASVMVKAIFDSADFHYRALSRQQIIDQVATYGSRAPGKNKVDDALKKFREGKEPFLREAKLGKKLLFSRSDVPENELMPYVEEEAEKASGEEIEGSPADEAQVALTFDEQKESE